MFIYGNGVFVHLAEIVLFDVEPSGFKTEREPSDAGEQVEYGYVFCHVNPFYNTLSNIRQRPAAARRPTSDAET